MCKIEVHKISRRMKFTTVKFINSIDNVTISIVLKLFHFTEKYYNDSTYLVIYLQHLVSLRYEKKKFCSLTPTAGLLLYHSQNSKSGLRRLRNYQINKM